MKNSLKNLVPLFITNEIKLIKNKKKFPGRTIWSSLIEKNVKIGMFSAIYRGVEIKNGVEIGKYTYVNPYTIIQSGSIGNFCSIAPRCQIGVYEHPLNYISTSPFTYEPFASQNIFGFKKSLWDPCMNPPIIENDVWIGSQSIILQGVKVGNGSIIAAGSVVTKDVPPFTIVGGVPAKVIRKRFDDKIIDFLQNLEWWNLSEEELLDLKDLFNEKDNWVKHYYNKIYV